FSPLPQSEKEKYLKELEGSILKFKKELEEMKELEIRSSIEIEKSRRLRTVLIFLINFLFFGALFFLLNFFTGAWGISLIFSMVVFVILMKIFAPQIPLLYHCVTDPVTKSPKCSIGLVGIAIGVIFALFISLFAVSLGFEYGVPLNFIIIGFSMLTLILFLYHYKLTTEGKFWTSIFILFSFSIGTFLLSTFLTSFSSFGKMADFSGKFASFFGVPEAGEAIYNAMWALKCTFATAMQGSPPPECIKTDGAKVPVYRGYKYYKNFDVKIGYRKQTMPISYDMPTVFAGKGVDIEIPIYLFNLNPKNSEDSLIASIEKIWIERNGNKTDRKWVLKGDTSLSEDDDSVPSFSMELKLPSGENVNKINLRPEGRNAPQDPSAFGKRLLFVINDLPCQTFCSIFEGGRPLTRITLHLDISVEQEISQASNLVYLSDERFENLVNPSEYIPEVPSNGPVDIVVWFEPNPVIGGKKVRMFVNLENKGNGEIKKIWDLKFRSDDKNIKGELESCKISFPTGVRKAVKSCDITLPSNINAPTKTFKVYTTAKYIYEYSVSSPQIRIDRSECTADYDYYSKCLSKFPGYQEQITQEQSEESEETSSEQISSGSGGSKTSTTPGFQIGP
ncbi:MAG: hypothetical protein J7L39_02440, partial [Candidatus Aenigmarchaeota archaeon]|nr:hypothetical protein [Candidatus Aenigmarchaeota archaeon]